MTRRRVTVQDRLDQAITSGVMLEIFDINKDHFHVTIKLNLPYEVFELIILLLEFSLQYTRKKVRIQELVRLNPFYLNFY